jgi:uncharacterized protein YjcR
MSDVTAVPVDQPSKGNWELAKVLWMQGVKPKDIAPQCGVTVGALKMRAMRYQWNTLKQQAVLWHLQQVRTETKATSLRSDLARKVKGFTQALPDNPTPREARELAGTLKDITDSASKVEGWSDTTTSKVDIHALAAGPELALPAGEKACLPEPAGETGEG